MCLAIPMKIVEIQGESGIVQMGAVQKTINIQLLSDVSTGDYVLVHAGFAIEKIDEKIARETLSLLDGLE